MNGVGFCHFDEQNPLGLILLGNSVASDDERLYHNKKNDSNEACSHIQGVPMARPKIKSLQINREWCKGCGICAAFCPAKVIELDHIDKAEVVRIDDCTACGMCALRCPDLAIHIETEDKIDRN